MKIAARCALLALTAGLVTAATVDDAHAARRSFNNGANYMGLDYQALSVAPANGGDFRPSAVRFRSGRMYDEYFGYEAHLSIGTDSDVQGNIEIDVDSYYGFAMRGQLPLNAHVAVYGLAGLGWTSYTRRHLITRQSSIGADSDFVYGGGIVFRLGQQAMLSAEWMSQLSNEELDLTTVNIGIARLF